MLCYMNNMLYSFDFGGLKMEKNSNHLYDLKIPVNLYLNTNQLIDGFLITIRDFPSKLDLSVCRLLLRNITEVPNSIKTEPYLLKTYFEFALKYWSGWKYGSFFDDALRNIGIFDMNNVSNRNPVEIGKIQGYVIDLIDAYSFYVLTHFLNKFSSFTMDQLFDNNNEMYDIINSYYYDKNEMKQLIEGMIQYEKCKRV